MFCVLFYIVGIIHFCIEISKKGNSRPYIFVQSDTKKIRCFTDEQKID